MTMPAGKYYVGDLCYTMHDEWNEVCGRVFPDNSDQTNYGEFTLADGRRFAIYSTAYGDGTYHSSEGTYHAVDSGSIGCILESDIKDNTYEHIDDLGAVIEFKTEFETSELDGTIHIGHVEIYTGDEDDYDEEEDY
jgi:hypothetical protein